MSLNNLQLNDHLLTALYAHTLVTTEAKQALPVQPEPQVAEVKTLRHLGNNAKGVAIVIDDASNAFLTDDALAFLTSILTACKLSLADVAIVNRNQADAAALQKKLDALNAKVVLLMGVQPLAIDLPIHFPEYQVQKFNNRTYLHTPALQEVQQHKGHKQSLWNCLKNIFGI